MPSLWDIVLDFLGLSKSAEFERKVAAACQILPTMNGTDNLKAYWDFLPADVKADGRVAAAYKEAVERTKSQGEMGIFGDMAKALVDGFGGLAPAMGKAATDTLQAGMTTLGPAAQALASGVIDPIVSMIVNSIQATGQQVPPDIVSKLKGVLLPAISLGLTFEVATNLAELIHPTKEMGLGGVAHFLHDTVGFKALTESYIYPVRQALIEIPTKQNIMRLVQPYALDPGRAMFLTRKRLLSPADYADALRWQGLQERYVPLLQQDVWRELSMRDIQRIYDVDRPPDAWTTQVLEYTGFQDENVARLLDNLKKRAVLKEIGDIKALQRSQYKAGVLSRSDYAAKLAARGVTGAEAQEFLDSVDLEREFDINKDLQDGYELKFLNGRSSEEELRAALGTLKIDPDQVDARLKYLVLKKLGKLTAVAQDKVLPESTIARAYRMGKLTKQAAAKRIDDLGYTTDDANLLVDLEDKDDSAAVTAEWVRAYEKQATNLRLSSDELRAKYLELGKSEAWADARLAYVTELIVGKEKTA